jgi:hypothetical protein
LSDLGRALGQSVDRYNRAVGSLEGRVLPAARRFESLGVAAEGAAIEAPQRIDDAPRRVTAPELAASRQDAPDATEGEGAENMAQSGAYPRAGAPDSSDDATEGARALP